MKRPLYLIGTTLALSASCLAAPISSLVDEKKVGSSKHSPLNLNDNHHHQQLQQEWIIPVPPTIDVESLELSSSSSNTNTTDTKNVYSLHRRHLLKHKPHPSYTNNNNNNNRRQLLPTQQQQRQQQRRQYTTNGIFHNLVILIRFADHTSRTLPSQSDISRLYNSNSNDITNNNDDVVPTGSVKQVYEHNSQSKFTLQTTVTPWIKVSQSESYYGNGNHGFSKFKEAIIEALEQLDAESDFDYNNFDLNDDNTLDGLGLLHSGYGAEFGGDDCYGTINTDRIWSHKGGLSWTSSGTSSGSDAPVKVNRYYVSSSLRGKCSNKIVRMGVICHEIGHYIGLPDLYDSTFLGVGLGGFGKSIYVLLQLSSR